MKSPPEIHLYAKDCPDGPDRIPQVGAVKWIFRVPLADGRVLRLHVGRKGLDGIRDLLEQQAAGEA